MGATFRAALPARRSPDPAFGSEGSVTLPPDFHGSAAAAQPDGTILIGGQSLPRRTARGGSRSSRLLPDGQPDPSFSGDGLAIADIATPSRTRSRDGLPGRRATSSVGTTSDASPDGLCPPQPGRVEGHDLLRGRVIGAGTYGSSRLEDLALQDDGSVVAVGLDRPFDPATTGSLIVRLRPDGSFDAIVRARADVVETVPSDSEDIAHGSRARRSSPMDGSSLAVTRGPVTGGFAVARYLPGGATRRELRRGRAHDDGTRAARRATSRISRFRETGRSWRSELAGFPRSPASTRTVLPTQVLGRRARAELSSAMATEPTPRTLAHPARRADRRGGKRDARRRTAPLLTPDARVSEAFETPGRRRATGRRCRRAARFGRPLSRALPPGARALPEPELVAHPGAVQRRSVFGSRLCLIRSQGMSGFPDRPSLPQA